MTPARIPADDSARVEALRQLGLLDTPAEERFDRLTRLAQAVFRTPMALVSLVDQDRQWFKSKLGVDACESPRDVSFCGHVVADSAVLVVEDTLLDERFRDNPFVTSAPNIRFYAGYPIHDKAGQSVGALCVADIVPRRFTEEDVRLLADLAGLLEREMTATEAATTDHLTGLLNRRGFELVADQAWNICRRNGDSGCLLFIDLDRFKVINDLHGHAMGDRALRQFARCLSETFRAADVVARLGGDEFVILMTKASEDEVQAALERLRSDVESVNAWPGTAYQLRFSAGFAALDSAVDVNNLQSAMGLADRRMYQDKTSARATLRNREQRLASAADDEKALQSDLNAALQAGEIRPAFQPIVDMQSGRVVALEALARWRHGFRGEVSPAVFIAAAERTGLILSLGDLMLVQCCRQLSLWRAEGIALDVRLSVNVSRAQLGDSKFPARVREILHETGVAAQSLQLEVTESLAMDDDRMLAALVDLSEQGVRLSLDDFGTGHSSLAALHRLPVRQLKIDRAFVSEMTSSAYHRAVVKAAMDVAKTLQLEVVAEGVETQRQAMALQALGCNLAQGWLYAKAQEAEEVRKLLTRGCGRAVAPAAVTREMVEE